MEKRIAVCIPTYNAGSEWISVLNAIAAQDLSHTDKVLIDSGSSDDTVQLALTSGFRVFTIRPADFDHGGTRQSLANKCDADIIIFMTQDAIPATPAAFANLVKAFEDPTVGMAYGRQLPHKGAKILEAHARLFNYPGQSRLKSAIDIPEYGFKTIFCSDSFSAYRREALEEAGGFPVGNIIGEDTIVAAKMIQSGWKVFYAADAMVYHSHSYSITQEFKRYFDTGVFHAANPSLVKSFGSTRKEGFRYLKSEVTYVLKNKPFLVFRVFVSIGTKWLGYKIGANYKVLPRKWCKTISMHQRFWQ